MCYFIGMHVFVSKHSLASHSLSVTVERNQKSGKYRYPIVRLLVRADLKFPRWSFGGWHRQEFIVVHRPVPFCVEVSSNVVENPTERERERTCVQPLFRTILINISFTYYSDYAVTIICTIVWKLLYVCNDDYLLIA